VLVIDDEAHEADGQCELIQRWGYQCRAARSAADALRICEEFGPHIMLSDLMMPEMDGMQLMQAIRETYPNVEFIMLTAFGTIDNAIEAMHKGAYDYFTKPVDQEKLKAVLDRMIDRIADREEVHRLTWDLAEHGRFGRLLGRSQAMKEIYRMIEQAAPSTASVLITGESGTGKEMVARTLHDKNPTRRGKPFVAVNCAAIPHDLLESEIFGHERGSFTGAVSTREGCFEQAHGGTLLLDEIGEMTPELQAKLLRLLEERVVRRIGGQKEIPVDVRLISSTNVKIDRAIAEGKFREDLFYRLNVLTLHLPPLRQRTEDIPLLARYFLNDYARQNGKTITDFRPEAVEAMQAHSWPGNVRELRNIVERAVIVARSQWIEVSDLHGLNRGGAAAAGRSDSPPANGAAGGNVVVSVGTTVEEAERRLIEETLRSTNRNKTKAAEILGISTKTLHNKLKKYLRERK